MPEQSPRPSAAERNLLFGILAFQMDFISRDALVRAMHAWVLEKVKPLAQLLQEQGALSAEHRAMLEPLVKAHIRAHHNDPRQSLGAVSSIGSVQEELEQLADHDLHDSLARVSESADPYRTRGSSVGTPTSAGVRFRVLRAHAKGGLGELSFPGMSPNVC